MSAVSSNSEVRLLGRSEAVRAILGDIECAARSGAKVLITGETGVGKEVVARLIHQQSARASSRLVTVNCAGLPDSLLESELFGHVRGSFTGAYRDKPGLLEMAPNGTVFLDEVGEMSTRMQVVLLRFLETGEIQRIGADRSHTRVNVRLITATNRDLPKEIAAGNFREDLFFRLNVIRMHLPPLRERIEDVPILFEHYLGFYCDQHRIERPQVAQPTWDALMTYRWPGNIRELRNVIERAVLLGGGAEITIEHLPAERMAHASGTGPDRGTVPPPHRVAAAPSLPTSEPAALGDGKLRGDVEAFERKRIAEVLDRCGGNQTRAARMLGISRRTLTNRLGQYGLPRPRKK